METAVAQKKESKKKSQPVTEALTENSSSLENVLGSSAGMPLFLQRASKQEERSTDQTADTKQQTSEKQSEATQDIQQGLISQPEAEVDNSITSPLAKASPEGRGDVSTQLPKAQNRATMQKEVAEATAEPYVTAQKTEGSPILLVPNQSKPTPPTPVRPSPPPILPPPPSPTSSDKTNQQAIQQALPPETASSLNRSSSQANAQGMSFEGAEQPQTAPSVKGTPAGTPKEAGQGSTALGMRRDPAKVQATKGESTKDAIQSTGKAAEGRAASRSASEPVAGVAAGVALVPAVAPDALRSQIPQRELTEEEVLSVVEQDRTPEQDRAEIQQLLTSLQTEAEQEKLSILAEAETQKIAIATHVETQVTEIQTTIATQIGAVQAQFASVRAAMTSHSEQQKALLRAEVEQNVIQLQTGTAERITQADTHFRQRQTSITTFAQQQQQQPQTIAQQEASRVDLELEAAAVQCQQAGDSEAARYLGDDDPKPQQRTSAREVARQSAADIREKKPAIAEDLRSRAEEFGERYLEYATTIATQITQARETLASELEGTTLDAETSLRGTVDAALAGIDARLATELQALDTAESESINRLQTAGNNAISQIRSGTEQASTEVDAAAAALIVEIDRGIEETTTVVSGEADPFLLGIRDLIESGRASMLITSTSGRAQLSNSATTARDVLSDITFSFASQASELVSTAQANAEQVQTQAQTAIAQSLEARRQQGQDILSGVATQQQDMINSVLAEVDRASEQARQEMLGITEQCRTELNNATTESITQAIKPRTDQVETRAHEAAEQVNEGWLTGLARAVRQILIGIVILVVVALVVAAIAAAFGVILTAWTAIMIAGAILLAVGLIISIIHRSGQRELQGKPGTIILLALSDTVGITGIYEGIRGKDIVTEKRLSDAARTERGVLGAVTLISLVVGVRSAIKGPPGGVYYIRPIGGARLGWLPSGEILPGRRAAFTRAGEGVKSVAQGLWAGARQGVRSLREWIRERLKSEKNSSSRGERDPARTRPTADPNVIEVDSPQRIKSTQPEWVFDEDYGAEVWRWYLYDEVSGARFCKVNVVAESATAQPTTGPELTLDVKNATLPNGQRVSLRANSFSWTPESLRASIRTFAARFGQSPAVLGGELAWDNLANFQKEFAQIRRANPGMGDEAIANEAIRRISFGAHRTALEYNDFSVKVSDFGDVILKNEQILQNVPKHVEVIAKPTPSTGTPVLPGQANQDTDGNE